MGETSPADILRHHAEQLERQAVQLRQEAARLDNQTRPAPIPVEQIKRAVCAAFGIAYDDLCTRRRMRGRLDARAAGVMLAREIRPELSWAAIGRLFNRDHSTVKLSYDAARAQLRASPEFASKVHEAAARLTGRDDGVTADG